MTIIDISLSLNPRLPRWPSSPPIRVHHSKRIEDGDGVNVTEISFDVHAGTHIEAPLHFLANGRALSDFALSRFIGRASVRTIQDRDRITAEDLEALDLPSDVERLLLKTRNSDLWVRAVDSFVEDYVALTQNAAEWISSRGIQLVGIDYLSIQSFTEPTPATHEVLMRSEVMILEGLNLAGVEDGEYQLICFPLSLRGTEAAPVRAVLVS